MFALLILLSSSSLLPPALKRIQKQSIHSTCQSRYDQKQIPPSPSKTSPSPSHARPAPSQPHFPPFCPTWVGEICQTIYTIHILYTLVRYARPNLYTMYLYTIALCEGKICVKGGAASSPNTSCICICLCQGRHVVE